MKNFLRWINQNWQILALYLVGTIFLIVLCFFNIESMTSSKLSSAEILSLEQSQNAQEIIQNPLNLPIKLFQYFLLKSSFNSIFLLRSISAFYGLILIIVFYVLAKKWFSPLISLVTTLMLASSTLFLHHSRLATFDILAPLALVSLLTFAWLVAQSKRPGHWLVLSGAVIAFFSYIPGLIWFMILALFAQRRHISKIFKSVPILSITIFIVVSIILVSPLIRASYLNPNLIGEWLALPQAVNLLEIIKNFFLVPASLLFRSQPDPVFNLGRLPYLDLITICFSAIGAYAFLIRIDLVRTRALIGALLISWILIAFKALSISILIPIIYLAVAGGVMFMLQQWFVVFPKNPIARNLAVALILAVASISVYYNLTRYFIAWPNNITTKQAFQEKLPANLLQ